MTRRAVRPASALCVVFSLAGCLSPTAYVDPGLPAVSKPDLASVQAHAPVQLLFEFQTKGATNAAATKSLRPAVLDVMQRSELFSEVTTEPTSNERRLFITINNVAAGPGTGPSPVVTGLTFGLAGTMVTDGYVCQVLYKSPGKPDAKFDYRHAIHSTIGNKAGPPGLTPYKLQDAAKVIVEQLTWSTLRDLSKNSSFD